MGAGVHDRLRRHRRESYVAGSSPPSGGLDRHNFTRLPMQRPQPRRPDLRHTRATAPFALRHARRAQKNSVARIATPAAITSTRGPTKIGIAIPSNNECFR